jgi:CrcB protein
LLLGTGSYETPGSAEDGAGLFAAADVVATVVTALVAACVGMSFAEALWT